MNKPEENAAPETSAKEVKAESIGERPSKTDLSANDKKKAKKLKKKKPVYIDDGHTVYSMENLPSVAGKKKKDDGVNVTKKERRAMIKAAYAYYLPRLLLGVLCFAAVIILLWLWLK